MERKIKMDNTQNMEFQQLESKPLNGEGEIKLDLLMDLQLPVSIELGRTAMVIKDVLDLQRGTVIELAKRIGEPLDIIVNGKKMAEGDVVVIEKQFGIRVTNIVDANERIKSIGQ